MAHWKDAFPIDLAEESRHSRREFARFLALVSAGFTAGIGYLWARRTPLEGAPESEGGAGHDHAVAICAASDLRPGQSRLFAFRDPHDKCILVRTPHGALKAYRQTCTHLGCAVRWDGARLECPCHVGFFEVEQGFPVQGPPSRPLGGIALEVREDGMVWALGDLPKPNATGSVAALPCPREKGGAA
ncbi:MAG: Rieske 2Fe-2S domain-containing protein [Holophagaceae bacterium]|nr:Rieske 2Fe-2S domain-containing protein [Holophagaceae bacterium]